VLLMSRQSLEALTPADRGLVIETARESVTVMREQWDASENAARQAVADFGVTFNAVDMPAFRKAADPLLQQYLQQPALAALTRRIRDFA